ncbi:hypothetical protein BX659_1027 [Orenia metallireducens]|jgi:hypothetical protein|uniref:Uncharacterized protein n=1 Tax=Orenia metallireducens TaxID=1413210 RepID=A0A285F1M5_9FIRM|nr:hypothetical protein [Orenia metallireducens]PRX34692.1 hypothetical protein BX659_1027 [Orenia metallireducens]SNY05195.1 hypothetical protein SAMN06265827_1017 [Orenia metallireducens]
MPNYSEALEVEEIAQEIIKEHRNDLANAQIYYIFRDKAAKSKCQ